MNIRWGKLGGQLGIGYCLAGIVLIFLGWNGAASYDRVTAQIPYLVSGGLAGLALVVLGASLLIVQSNRTDRAALQASVDELRGALERLAAPGTPGRAGAAGAATGSAARGSAGGSGGITWEASGTDVVAGPNAYHRPDCRLVEGQAGLVPMTLSAAQDRGLTPCRICAPA
jgi:hypothetical protein